jgi:hypothetical protein
METKMKSAAATAGYIGTRAVEDHHAAHAEHLTAALPMPGVTELTSVDGFFSCPACRTNPLTHARRSKVVEHMKKIALQK